MPNISHRIFGSDIPLRVKKRLEALQKMAERSHDPGEQIEDAAYKDETGASHSYKELLGVDESNSSGYLSSKTPFVRMWTAVNLVMGTVEKTYKSYFDVDFTPQDRQDGKTIRKNKQNEFEKVKYDPRGNPVIYQVGNHEFNQSRNPTESLQTDTGGLGIEGEFFHELKDNDFFKPQAGITSVNVGTEGPLGAIKKTTVSFTVHNLKDYDEVYSRFFLRPGAQLVVDFGWNDGTLYDPRTIVSIETGSDLEKKIENFLKNDTKNGDVDILIGNVTTFDTKITQEGSFECTLEIISKNTALFSDSLKVETRKNIANNLELSVLDHIVYKATNGEVKVTDWTKTPAEQTDIIEALNKRSHIKATLGREITEQERMDGISYGGSDFTTDIFMSIGWLEDNMLTPKFGFTNEVPNDNEGLNLEKNEKLEARFNSSNSFVTFDKNLYNRQRYGKVSEYKFLYPDKWDISYNVLKNKIPDAETAYGRTAPKAPEGQNKKKYPNAHGEVGKLQSQIDKLNKKIVMEQDMITRSEGGENVYWGRDWKGVNESKADISLWEGEVSALEAKKTAWKNKVDIYYSYEVNETTGEDRVYLENPDSTTAIDRRESRIPLRELFISLDLVKRSLAESNNVSEMLTMILDEINNDSQDVFNLKFAANKYLGHELAIVDANHLNIQWESRENTLFDNLFQFKPFSRGSIVKDFDFSLTTPKDGFQNMMAISTLQSGQQYAPRDALSAQNQGMKILSDNLDINALKDDTSFGPARPDVEVGFTYIPEIGRSNLLNRIQDDQMQGIIAMTFRGESKPKDIVKPDQDKQTMYDHIAASKAAGLSSTEHAEATGVKIEEKRLGYSITQPSGKYEFVPKIDWDKALAKADPTRLIKYQGSGIPRQILTTMKTYYEELARRTHYAKAPMILPVTLTLKIHGTGLLVPGDMFRVDYMPKRYLDHVYFQITKISHEIGSTWTTTLETTMRMRTMEKPRDIGGMADLNSEIYLASDIFTNAAEFRLRGIDDYVDVMDEIRPMFGLVKDTENLIGVFSFRANKKVKIKIPEHKTGEKLKGTIFNTTEHLDTYTGYGENSENSISPKEVEVAMHKFYFLIVNKLQDGTGYIWTISPRKDTSTDFKDFDVKLVYRPRI